MRIIGGKYGKRRLDLPKGLTCRPTTDKAKESLFNILQNTIEFDGKTAMDLFAGTGSISYELVSRGCSRVVAVEQNQRQLRFIHQTKLKFEMKELEVRKADALRLLGKHSAKYDFIFMDPPYDYPYYNKLPELVFERELLKEGGMLIIEHDERLDFSSHPHFTNHRNYSKVNFSFFA